MTRLLIGVSRLLLTPPNVSLLVVLTVVVLSNMLMAANLLSPDGPLNPTAGGNPGSMLALGWFAGNGILAVWLAQALVTTLMDQIQEWIAGISASMRWR